MGFRAVAWILWSLLALVGCTTTPLPSSALSPTLSVTPSPTLATPTTLATTSSVTPSPIPELIDLVEEVPEDVDAWEVHRLPHVDATLPVPPNWIIQEHDELSNTLYSVVYRPPLWDSPEDCGYQCPTISAVIYRDAVTVTHGTTADVLWTWLEEHSTSKPFGADVEDAIIFFGVEQIEETMWKGQQALSFYNEAMGIRSYHVLTTVNGHVVGLSKSHVDRFEFEPVALQDFAGYNKAICHALPTIT